MAKAKTRTVRQPAPPFRIGQRVRQAGKPFRHGTVRSERGFGPATQVTVGFDGWITVTVPASTLVAA